MKSLKNEKIGVYPGTFDPVTYGHLDILKRASKIFDKVVVCVAYNVHKNPLLSLDERVKLLKENIENLKLKNIEIDSFSGLLVDYLKKRNIKVIIRGLRAVTDFDYEFAYACMNRKLNPEVETVFLMSSEKYLFISSSLVKEVIRLGGDISEYVPENVVQLLKQKLRRE